MRRLLPLLVLLFASPVAADVLKGTIYASPNNGPFVYTFELDGALQNNVNNVASANAAFDAIKGLVAAQGGTILKVTFNVNLTTKQVFSRLQPTVTNGPWAYTFEVDGAWNSVVHSVANVSVGADAVRTLVGAEGGTFVKATITVVTL